MLVDTASAARDVEGSLDYVEFCAQLRQTMKWLTCSSSFVQADSELTAKLESRRDLIEAGPDSALQEARTRFARNIHLDVFSSLQFFVYAEDILNNLETLHSSDSRLKSSKVSSEMHARRSFGRLTPSKCPSS
jgi:hypothetical protein